MADFWADALFSYIVVAQCSGQIEFHKVSCHWVELHFTKCNEPSFKWDMP